MSKWAWLKPTADISYGHFAGNDLSARVNAAHDVDDLTGRLQRALRDFTNTPHKIPETKADITITNATDIWTSC